MAHGGAPANPDAIGPAKVCISFHGPMRTSLHYRYRLWCSSRAWPREFTGGDHGGHGVVVRGVGNAAHQRLRWLSEDVNEVHEVLAEQCEG